MQDARIAQEKVPELYRRIAPVYDAWSWLTERKACDRCLELAAIEDGEDVLEVAVGTGRTFVRILEANPSGRSEGIDLTAAMLARAEEKAARTGIGAYHLARGDARRLDYPSSSFDVLISCYLFDLLPERDILSALDEYARVLRTGGRLAIVNMTHGKRWYNGMWSRLYRMSPALLGGCRAISSQPLLQRCGFRDTRREYISQFTFPSEVVFGVAP